MLLNKERLDSALESFTDVSVVHPELREVVLFVEVLQCPDPDLWRQIRSVFRSCSHLGKISQYPKSVLFLDCSCWGRILREVFQKDWRVSE